MDTVLQGNGDNNITNNNAGDKGSEKTFTQAELDSIIAERLTRDRAKYADYEALKEKAKKFDEYEEANKSELEKATERAKSLEAELNSIKKENELREMRTRVAKESNLPDNYFEFLTGTDEDTCKMQAKKLVDGYKENNNGYPPIKDGGEVSKINGTATRDEFADWFNKNF